MTIFKTPKEKVMENAGIMPASKGIVKTPQQMLVEKTNLLPRLAKGKKVKKLSPKDMEAELVVLGKTPPKLKTGGKSKIKK